MDNYGDEFFQGGGEAVASGKFTNDSGPGGRTQVDGMIVGTVVSTKQMNQTDFDTGEDIPDGKGGIKQQLQVILQTDYRNWDKASKPLEDENKVPLGPEHDDGKRAIYVKGWMIGAVGDAIRKVQAPGLRPGGKLAVKVTELVPPRSGNGNPFAKYIAQYQPPAPGDAMLASAPTQEQPQQQAPAPQAPPQQQAPAPQAPPQQPALPQGGGDPFGGLQAPQAPPAGSAGPGGWGQAPAYDEPPF